MVIMVSGGSDSLHRFRQWLKWPLARSTSARVGKGIVTFASTDEVLPLVYRPNLSVRVSYSNFCVLLQTMVAFIHRKFMTCKQKFGLSERFSQTNVHKPKLSEK